MHNAQSFAVAIPAKPRGAPQLLLQLGFLRAFSRELVDAGFPIAVILAVSGGGSLFVGTDGFGAYNMSLVVARMDCQSSNTVKGTSSRSQYVMRSEGRSVSFGN